jgi:hypothetical protein
MSVVYARGKMRAPSRTFDHYLQCAACEYACVKPEKAARHAKREGQRHVFEVAELRPGQYLPWEYAKERERNAAV